MNAYGMNCGSGWPRLVVCQGNGTHLRETTNSQHVVRSQAEGFLIALSRDANAE